MPWPPVGFSSWHHQPLHVQAVAALHNAGIAHLDLKMPNVLADIPAKVVHVEDINFELTDFGCAIVDGLREADDGQRRPVGASACGPVPASGLRDALLECQGVFGWW